MAGRPFVDSMTPEQVETAINKHQAYLAARRVGSIKALALHYDVSTATLYRRMTEFQEKKHGTRH